jgi:UDP-MurNAc hydroxylase
VKIQLVSHASVLIETVDAVIWCDPWIEGKAFNDSWALHPPAAWDPADLARIDYLWISHEHPDHFHIPTLKSLPPDFKRRVTVLFQQNNSRKMWEAFRRLGFVHHRELPHRRRVALTFTTEVYCYQEGQMNSCLVVRHDGENVINVNDAEIRAADCERIVRDVGPCATVLNQFSIAGYNGLTPRDVRLRTSARGVVDKLVDNHLGLKAEATIPFASFVYFCTDDNAYVNAYANTPRTTVDALARVGARAVVLYPGEAYDTRGPAPDNAACLARFDAAYAGLAAAPTTRPPVVPFGDIAAAFARITAHLRERYGTLALAPLRPFVVAIPDLECRARFGVRDARVALVDATTPVDLTVCSQPLHFAFSHPFGVQTLGVSARFTLHANARNWALHRVLFAMNNAEIYLRPKYFFTGDNLRYFVQRARGAPEQVLRRLATMTD